jgi:hypothetical protein
MRLELRGSGHERAVSLIARHIERMGLQLTGKNVLTEVGSSAYLYTPFIPLFAGAAHVRAWAVDSVHGHAAEIREECLRLARILSVEDRLVVRINSRPAADVEDAHVITNSGAVRPIDEALLKSTVGVPVVALMYEAWELRAEDLDLAYCRSRGIRVAGTWESHPAVRAFDYVGTLALKLTFEAGFEVFMNHIAVWSDDAFGVVVADAFRRCGADVLCTTDQELLRARLSELDAVFFCNYEETRVLVGDDGLLNIDEVLQIKPTLGIIHLYGPIDSQTACGLGLNVYPRHEGRARIMSHTLAYVGVEPLIRLQVAGFKVAEELLSSSVTELSQRLL